VKRGVLLVLGALSTACPAEPWDEAECPPEGTALTYESFGRPFMERHCQYCHASFIENRQGAPGDYVFDTHADVIEWIDHIYERSAGDNVSMPPGPEDPPEEEREQLKEWLACGAP
jgi:uncharacterized membrane protein